MVKLAATKVLSTFAICVRVRVSPPLLNKIECDPKQILMDKETKALTKEDYNAIPVHYCVDCGSLRIRRLPYLGGCYCDHCGSGYISKASIESWLHLQKTKYKPIYRDYVRKEKIVARRANGLFG